MECFKNSKKPVVTGVDEQVVEVEIQEVTEAQTVQSLINHGKGLQRLS